MVPIHIIRPLTNHDRELLEQNLSKQKKSLRLEMLIYAGMSLVAPFLTNRPNQRPLIENMSYGWAVLLFAGIMMIPLSFSYFGKVHKAVLALQKDTKRVILTTVIDKIEKPIFHKEDYCLKLEDGYVPKLYFPRSQFDKFQIDEPLLIELSEDGKQVIKINEATETLAQAIEKMEHLGPSDVVQSYWDTLFTHNSDSKFSIRPFFSFFLPSKDDFITKFILDINLAVFILMLLSGVKIYKPLVISLVHWGGNQWYPAIVEHEYWRLVTNLFVHAGIVHLLFNMLSFLFIAVFLERVLGRLGFALLYIVTGITASLTSVLWHSNDIVSVGASGAIFGLYLSLIHISEPTRPY